MQYHCGLIFLSKLGLDFSWMFKKLQKHTFFGNKYHTCENVRISYFWAYGKHARLG